MGWVIFGLFLGLVAVVANFVIVAFTNDSNYSDSPKLKVRPSLVVLSFIVPVLIMTGIASAANIPTGHIGVMTHFGQVTGQELHEGFHLKNPFDVAHLYSIQTEKIEANAAAASKDLQDVNVKLVLNYRLESGQVSRIHQTIGEDYEEKVVDNAIQEVVKSSTAKFNATELITSRAVAKVDAEKALKDRLAPAGVIVDNISIVDLQFSKEFTAAIEKKQVAQQQAEQAKFNAQKAEQDAQAEINRAKGSSEAQRLQEKTLTPLLIQKQFLETWDGHLPQVTGGGNILNLDNIFKAPKK